MRTLSWMSAVVVGLLISSFTPQSDTLAVYAEGEEAMYKTIAREIKYPQSARLENRMGLVLVVFTVDEKGDVVDATTKLKQGQLLHEIVVVANPAAPGQARIINEDIEKEAVRAVEQLGKFTPAQKDGKAVSSTLIMPIKFKLNYTN